MWALWAVFGCGCVMLIYAIVDDFKNYSKNKEQNEVKSMTDEHIVELIKNELNKHNYVTVDGLARAAEDIYKKCLHAINKDDEDEQKLKQVTDEEIKTYIGHKVKIEFYNAIGYNHFTDKEVKTAVGFLCYDMAKNEGSPYRLVPERLYFDYTEIEAMTFAASFVKSIELCEVKND